MKSKKSKSSPLSLPDREGGYRAVRELANRLKRVHDQLHAASRPEMIVDEVIPGGGVSTLTSHGPSMGEVLEDDACFDAGEWVVESDEGGLTRKRLVSRGTRIVGHYQGGGFALALHMLDVQLATEPEDRAEPWKALLGDLAGQCTETMAWWSEARSLLAASSDGVLRCGPLLETTFSGLVVAVSQVVLDRDGVLRSGAEVHGWNRDVLCNAPSQERDLELDVIRLRVIRDLGTMLLDPGIKIRREFDLAQWPVEEEGAVGRCSQGRSTAQPNRRSRVSSAERDKQALMIVVEWDREGREWTQADLAQELSCDRHQLFGRVRPGGGYRCPNLRRYWDVRGWKFVLRQKSGSRPRSCSYALSVYEKRTYGRQQAALLGLR